jgi:D-alanyl-D-alanine carboxypeptidase/D-alanyl-D-alanine-endopeptidase (penicillin-binding protein 4)
MSAANQKLLPLIAAILLFSAVLSAQQMPQPQKSPEERADVTRLRARVESALSSNGAQRAYWGAVVVDADTGETLYAVNGDHYFKPASNMKLFTTIMALATLGPDFRAHTTVETSGTVDKTGYLRGDLALIGRGDANLSNRVFPFSKQGERSGPADRALAELADEVVAHGVKRISGDVVADDTYFALTRFPPGWTVDDTVWSYGAAISAIAVNDNTLDLLVRPGAVGEPVRISWAPWPGAYSVRNEARTVRAGTPDAQLSLARDPESRVFVLGGTMPTDSSLRDLPLGVPEPAEWTAIQFKRLLEARGIKVMGRSRALHAGDPGTEAHSKISKILAQRFSPNLIADVRLTNKLSQNLHAELMLRVAAREKAGAQTLDDALKFSADFRKSIDIAPEDVIEADGSGLSRNNLATPQSFVTALLYAAKQPWGEQFISTLPVAGEDGTLENRMKNTAASGRVHAKTGTVNNSAGLSGYATTIRGEHIVFSLFSNNNAGKGRDASAVLDQICVAIVEELGSDAVSVGSPEPASVARQPQ